MRRSLATSGLLKSSLERAIVQSGPCIVPSSGWGPHPAAYGYSLTTKLLRTLNASSVDELAWWIGCRLPLTTSLRASLLSCAIAGSRRRRREGALLPRVTSAVPSARVATMLEHRRQAITPPTRMG